MSGSIHDWIEGFEKEMKERFGKTVRIAIVEKNYKSLIEIIIQVVAEVTNVPYSVIVSNKRIGNYASDARNLSTYFTRLFTQAGYTEIGNVMGGRDHSTIIHQERVAKNRIATNDPNTKNYFIEIENRLKEVFKTNNNEQQIQN